MFGEKMGKKSLNVLFVHLCKHARKQEPIGNWARLHFLAFREGPMSPALGPDFVLFCGLALGARVFSLPW